MNRFYLGTHRAAWLARTDVPLFVSAAQLRGRRTFPRARGAWALDSGGFTELQLYGRWTVDARTYAAEVRRWAAEVGAPDFAAIQDWMCEPFMLGRTGLSIAEHQRRTIASYLELRELAPEIPWMPVVQGWGAPDYLDHLDAYERAGVDLRTQPIVGVGSICRRQATSSAVRIITALSTEGVRVHAFGAKAEGLRLFGDRIASADSMAWSFVARRRPVLLESCEGTGHKNCANCLRWALEWRHSRIVAGSAGAQTILAWGAA
jgi:hypothetical protein